MTLYWYNRIIHGFSVLLILIGFKLEVSAMRVLKTKSDGRERANCESLFAVRGSSFAYIREAMTLFAACHLSGSLSLLIAFITTLIIKSLSSGLLNAIINVIVANALFAIFC